MNCDLYPGFNSTYLGFILLVLLHISSCNIFLCLVEIIAHVDTLWNKLTHQNIFLRSSAIEIEKTCTYGKEKFITKTLTTKYLSQKCNHNLKSLYL